MVALTATVVASMPEPRPVQVVLSGVVAGKTYTVTGSTAGSSWPVPGGVGVSDGTQVVLVDNRAALNASVTYSAVVDGVTYSAAPVTVTYSGARRYVLQSLDGQTVVTIWLDDNGLPREPLLRSTAFDVPGRRRPPARFQLGGDGGGSIIVRTDATGTERLTELLLTGRPVVLRTDGTVRDLAAVELLLPQIASNRLNAGTAMGPDARRRERTWTISYLLVDDPEPTTPLSAWTWDDFDAAMADETWATFDALFTGDTWNDFDTTDWGQHQ